MHYSPDIFIHCRSIRKVMTKTWDRGYDELLNMTNLPSLKVATSKLVASKWSHSQSSAAVIET